jgi:hypothetical protein
MMEPQPGQRASGSRSDQLVSSIEDLVEREKQLRTTILACSVGIFERQRSLLATLSSLETHVEELRERRIPDSASSEAGPAETEKTYDAIVPQITGIVVALTPPGSTVLVVSKGDNHLVELPERRGWHFPQDEGGQYAGFHPADGDAAVRDLQRLRHLGAQFIVFPEPSYWWLDYYESLTKHLDQYRKVWADCRCIVYDLRTETSAATKPLRHRRPSTFGLAGLLFGQRR